MADPLEQAAIDLLDALNRLNSERLSESAISKLQIAAVTAFVRSPAVRRELVKDNRQQAQHFDDWWQTDGKFFDPDTDDVPWFDKRKDLAEYAWHRGRAPEKAADIMTNVCQIIDVVKQEWGEAWSDWDQSVRDAISEWLKQYHGL